MKRISMALLLLASALPLSAQAATSYKLYRYVPNLIVDNVPSGQTGGNGGSGGSSGGTVTPPAAYEPSWAAPSPTSLAFGDVAMNANGADTVSVTNTGTQPQSLTASVSGTDAAAFALAGGCNNVAPGQSCQLSVTFTPIFEGAHAASLNIGATAVPLSGTGFSTFMWQAISAVPASYNFNTVYLGEQSALVSYTFRNRGTSTQTTAPVIVGANPGQFKAVTNCNNVAVNGTCQLRVNYVPTVMGTALATVKFGTFSINIRGNSTEKPVSWTSVGTSGSPNFGNFSITDTNFKSYVISYQNTGTATGSMAMPTLSDDTAFSATSSCSNVASNQMCNIEVFFTPMEPGTYNSVLTLVDGSTVNLSGTGTP